MLSETPKVKSLQQADMPTGFARLDAEAFPVFEKGWVWLVARRTGTYVAIVLSRYAKLRCGGL